MHGVYLVTLRPMRKLRIVFVFFALTGLFGQNSSQSKYEIVVDRDVPIVMRDGVKLVCDIYRPGLNGKAVEGKYPVILERTPYGKRTGESWAKYFVPRGYIGIAQDI